jgi:hypothetical protein
VAMNVEAPVHLLSHPCEIQVIPVFVSAMLETDGPFPVSCGKRMACREQVGRTLLGWLMGVWVVRFVLISSLELL